MKRICIVVFSILAFIYTPVRSNGQVGAAALLTKLGNVDVTPQAEALAKVYVDYIKKDLDIYFFERFTLLINQYPELRVMFPATSTYLDNVPNYQYTNLLSAMRSAFVKDLRTLPRDITQITAMDTASCCNSAKKISACKDRIAHYQTEFHKKEGELLILALLAADGFINKANGAVVLNNMATSPNIATDTFSICKIVRISNVFSKCLLNPNNGSTWLTSSDFKDLLSDAGKRRAFIKNVITQLSNEKITVRNPSIDSMIKSIQADSTNLIAYLKTIADAGEALDASFKKVRMDTIKSNKNMNIAKFIDDFNQFFLAITSYNKIDTSIHIDNDTRLIFNSMSDAFEISKDVLLKDYQSAVFTCIQLVDSLLPTKIYTDHKGKIKIDEDLVDGKLAKYAYPSITTPDINVMKNTMYKALNAYKRTHLKNGKQIKKALASDSLKDVRQVYTKYFHSENNAALAINVMKDSLRKKLDSSKRTEFTPVKQIRKALNSSSPDFVSKVYCKYIILDTNRKAVSKCDSIIMYDSIITFKKNQIGLTIAEMHYIHNRKRARLQSALESHKPRKINREYYRDVYKPKFIEKNAELESNTSANFDLKQNFLKYGQLIAAVVSADSASQITKVIEQVALPPSSSIIKKTTRYSIAVQGYAGFTAGCLGNGFNGNQFKSFNSLSPYAPLGVSFSRGLRSGNPSNKRTSGSLSLSLSLIDIGALVAYDLKNKGEKTQDSISIKLANIFAPGVNLVYGIPGVPISCGTGFQYQPEMNYVTSSGASLNTNSGFRWQVFAAFDLTLFNLRVSRK